MNTPWEVARVDRELFGEQTDTLTRDEILRDYAAFAQKEQDEALEKGWNLSNSILCRPLQFLFATEHAGSQWRGIITSEAASKDTAGKVGQVILSALEQFRTLNPEALLTRNGVKVEKPAW